MPEYWFPVLFEERVKRESGASANVGNSGAVPAAVGLKKLFESLVTVRHEPDGKASKRRQARKPASIHSS